MPLTAENFALWRQLCAEQKARHNPYVSYAPEVDDVLAMMDEIERLRILKSEAK